MVEGPEGFGLFGGGFSGEVAIIEGEGGMLCVEGEDFGEEWAVAINIFDGKDEICKCANDEGAVVFFLSF